MEITFREIREFGESLILLDQHPSQISLPALGNTYCTICLNLKHSKDVNAMSQCMLLEGQEKDLLGNLEVGQAMVKLQGRIPRPFIIQIPEFSLEKGMISDAMVQKRMEPVIDMHHLQHVLDSELSKPVSFGDTAATKIYPAPASLPGSSISRSPQPAARISPTQGVPPASPQPLSEKNPELCFLKDVHDYPDSGIAARYKRLNISVRQGQRLKAYLAAEGLIKEQEERTPTGKLLRIYLTENGRQMLKGNA